jgi:hypothetical protein
MTPLYLAYLCVLGASLGTLILAGVVVTISDARRNRARRKCRNTWQQCSHVKVIGKG